ncbi:MAG TPA: [Fe-Fe] hydrogenase large subunit C-terminal domain-containing protein [Bacteroidales bacterium]|nr:[Fe-Fe] hydrogenase large subunit C-terminal domain-containing protein [Bacteroidales bacterium]HNS47345.1 [Fe-Fe] hydrogenase large subunit C-terminal domain-containing protein [Bacteroidales bacterium]
MRGSVRDKLVYTVKDRCRVCYTCVRECPVKAIRIINGQAEVISERCIGCGNCVVVCSQQAKMYVTQVDSVQELLSSSEKVVALVAPSFPAEFTEFSDFRVFVGKLRALGFDHVMEVAFGADLVAGEYARLIDEEHVPSMISSDCPAIVYYIRHYHPELVPYLAPVVSPMEAAARVAKKKYGGHVKLVFIGPCIAKKAESDEVDEIITFEELRQLFTQHDSDLQDVAPSDFDPPHAGKGAIFPLSRGLLQSMNKTDDLCDGNILIAEGKPLFKEAIRQFSKELKGTHHLQLLCCEGCIMGPGMSRDGQRYIRRNLISRYASKKMSDNRHSQWVLDMDAFKDIPLSKSFKPADRRIPLPNLEEIDQVLLRMGKKSPSDHLNCGACGYDTCEEHAIAILEGLAETEMCLPYTIEKLHKSIEELNFSNEKLASAQQALKQSEKMATMGQLSAGIAHELNNPLGVITMYSNILIDESKPGDPIRKDLELIAEQASRCKGIVGGLLNFARKNQVKLELTNMKSFIEKSFQSILKNDSVSVSFECTAKDTEAMIDQDQMMQVLTNLEKNAVEAMPDGGNLKIILSGDDESIEIKVADTGTGISRENMEKIFTPFFTTKQIGRGTGLGLPLIYGIVKMHRGQINVTSNADPAEGPTGTAFTMKLPRVINQLN